MVRCTCTVTSSLRINFFAHYTTVAFAPSFLPNGTLQDQVAFTGKNLTLSCQATGAPEPSYEWLRDGSSISSGLSDFFDTSVPGLLKIPNIIGQLASMYTCVARSSVGMDNSSAMVIVTGTRDTCSTYMCM